MIGSLGKIIVICAAAGLLAAAHVAWRKLPMHVDEAAVVLRLDRKEKVRGTPEIREKFGFNEAKELQSMLGAGGAVVIDARTRDQFEQGHLRNDGDPPTLNIEPDKVAANLDRLMQVQTQPIVIYCNSEQCELSDELFLMLQPYGFNMKIYVPGWDGIVAAKLPTMSGPDQWTPMGAVAPAASTETDATEQAP